MSDPIKKCCGTCCYYLDGRCIWRSKDLSYAELVALRHATLDPGPEEGKDCVRYEVDPFKKEMRPVPRDMDHAMDIIGSLNLKLRNCRIAIKDATTKRSNFYKEKAEIWEKRYWDLYKNHRDYEIRFNQLNDRIKQLRQERDEEFAKNRRR